MKRLTTSLMQRKAKGQRLQPGRALDQSSHQKIRIASQPTLFTLKKTQMKHTGSQGMLTRAHADAFRQSPLRSSRNESTKHDPLIIKKMLATFGNGRQLPNAR